MPYCAAAPDPPVAAPITMTRRSTSDAPPSGFVAETGSLLRLAAPIVASQLGQIGMNAADTIMVGPLGAVPLAAAGLGSALHFVVMMVGAGVIVGMNPLVSQAFGAHRMSECRHVLRQGFLLALVLSVPVALVTLLGEPVALLFGQDPEVAALTGAYMAALAPGIPPVLAFMAQRQYLEATGHTRPPMTVTLLALLLNIGLNRIFIHGGGFVPALGVVGSGWATTLVRWFMFGALMVYLAARPRLSPFRARERSGWRPDLARMRTIVRIGTPIGLQFGLEIGLFAFAAVMMGWFGPIELAAHQVTINIAATTFMVALGTSMAGTVLVGQHIGAGRLRQARLAVTSTYTLAVGFMGLCALAFLLAPEALVGLYTDDPAIVRTGRRLLIVAAAFQLFDGGQVAGMGVLRGVGDTRVPMLLAGAGYWGVGIGTGLLLGFVLPYGPVGVWIGLCAGLGAVAVSMAIRVRAVLWLRDPRPLGTE